MLFREEKILIFDDFALVGGVTLVSPALWCSIREERLQDQSRHPGRPTRVVHQSYFSGSSHRMCCKSQYSKRRCVGATEVC